MLSSLAHGAGFDCERASTKDEYTICANDTLSRLDSELSDIYAIVSKEVDIKAEQIAWIKRRRLCKEDVGCIEELYRDRIAELNSYVKAHEGKLTSNLVSEKKNISSEATLQNTGSSEIDTQAWSAKKLALASELLTGLQATPLGDINKNTFTNNSFEYCETFFHDLQSGENIDFIKPVVSTEDYDDPQLMKYREKAVYELKNLVSTKLGIDAGSTMVSYGKYDYRIYEVDIDNNPENGIEAVFFAGNWGMGSNFKIYSSSKSGRLNLVNSLQTQVTAKDGKHVRNSVVEIIIYKKNIFILDMGSYGFSDSPVRKLGLHYFGERDPDKGTAVCVFNFRSGVEKSKDRLQALPDEKRSKVNNSAQVSSLTDNKKTNPNFELEIEKGKSYEVCNVVAEYVKKHGLSFCTLETDSEFEKLRGAGYKEVDIKDFRNAYLNRFMPYHSEKRRENIRLNHEFLLSSGRMRAWYFKGDANFDGKTEEILSVVQDGCEPTNGGSFAVSNGKFDPELGVSLGGQFFYYDGKPFLYSKYSKLIYVEETGKAGVTPYVSGQSSCGESLCWGVCKIKIKTDPE